MHKDTQKLCVRVESWSKFNRSLKCVLLGLLDNKNNLECISPFKTWKYLKHGFYILGIKCMLSEWIILTSFTSIMSNWQIIRPNSPCKSWGTASLINTQMVSSVYHVENVHLNMCQISNPSQHPQSCPFWSHSPTQPLFFLLQCWAKNPSSASCAPSKDSLIHSFGHFKVTANKNATKWSLNFSYRKSKFSGKKKKKQKAAVFFPRVSYRFSVIF